MSTSKNGRRAGVWEKNWPSHPETDMINRLGSWFWIFVVIPTSGEPEFCPHPSLWSTFGNKHQIHKWVMLNEDWWTHAGTNLNKTQVTIQGKLLSSEMIPYAWRWNSVLCSTEGAGNRFKDGISCSDSSVNWILGKQKELHLNPDDQEITCQTIRPNWSHA